MHITLQYNAFWVFFMNNKVVLNVVTNLILQTAPEETISVNVVWVNILTKSRELVFVQKIKRIVKCMYMMY